MLMALHDTISIVYSSHSCSLSLFNVHYCTHLNVHGLLVFLATHSVAHLLTQLTHSLTQLTHSLTQLTHSHTHMLTHSLTHSYTHTHSLTHSLTHSFTHSNTHSLIHTLMHSPHSLTYSYTNPLIYSLLTHAGVRIHFHHLPLAASSWHSGSVLAGKARGRGFESHRWS